MRRLIQAYNAHLYRSFREAGKYGSVGEIKGQIIPWMVPLLLAIVASAADHGSGHLSGIAVALGFFIFFAGICIVCLASQKVEADRRQSDSDDSSQA